MALNIRPPRRGNLLTGRTGGKHPCLPLILEMTDDQILGVALSYAPGDDEQRRRWEMLTYEAGGMWAPRRTRMQKDGRPKGPCQVESDFDIPYWRAFPILYHCAMILARREAKRTPRILTIDQRAATLLSKWGAWEQGAPENAARDVDRSLVHRWMKALELTHELIDWKIISAGHPDFHNNPR